VEIGSIKLEILYKLVVVASNAKIDIPLFQGNSSTTSDDILKHYSSCVMKHAPGFIFNTEILGANVTDATLQTAARLAMVSTLAGAVAGSVVGVLAVDGVKGAIASGKKDRNASADDRYRFGDFTRGTLRGVNKATKSGAEQRRDNDRVYVPGSDFTAGTTTSISKYAKSNKSKLVEASAGGAGAMIGFAVAGPLGFIAGSYLGGKIGSRAIQEDGLTNKKKEGPLQEDGLTNKKQEEPRLQHINPRQQQQVNGQGNSLPTEDLLGINIPTTTHHTST